jgi:hypothetical protein
MVETLYWQLIYSIVVHYPTQEEQCLVSSNDEQHHFTCNSLIRKIFVIFIQFVMKYQMDN